mmetsp:Transcript_7657/g.11174  ORF Transcript_7657/g.11174 Transcript_7657/m.11174 type:complete len:103 (-) Transcript_7657:67-375(-)
MPKWDARFQQLVEYKQQNGDTLVPQTYPPDPGFGKWVMRQRCEYSQQQRGLKNCMTDYKMTKLNSIGFYWVSPRSNVATKRKRAPNDDSTDDDEHVDRDVFY